MSQEQQQQDNSAVLAQAQASPSPSSPYSMVHSSPSTISTSNTQQNLMACPTRVSVIPSFAPKNETLRNMQFGATTLALKLEPSIPSKISHNQQTSKSVSVFSGPHYRPNKYGIKTSTNAKKQKRFLPDQFSLHSDIADPKQSMPRLEEYFQNALQDGSYFKSYTDYNPQDPENFRHAFCVENKDSKLTSVPVQPNEAAQIYVTTRETRHIQTSLPEENKYVIEPKIIYAKRIKDELRQQPPSPSPVSQPYHRQLSQSSSASPATDQDIQDERVNQILEAANLLDFSGELGISEAVIPDVGPNHKRWQRQNSDSSGSDMDVSSGNNPLEQIEAVNKNEPPSKRNFKGKQKMASKSLSDLRNSYRTNRGSVRTAGKTVARLPLPSAATSYVEESEGSFMSFSNSTVSPAPESSSSSDKEYSHDSTVNSGRKRQKVNPQDQVDPIEQLDLGDSVEHLDPEYQIEQEAIEIPVEQEDAGDQVDQVNPIQINEKPIPSKAMSKVKCREWGKFLQSWRIKKRPLVCSICSNSVVGSDAPSVVYCDSPQCDVLIHRSCLNRVELPILVQNCWLCDKCFFLDTLEQNAGFIVTCALCPNTNGMICKLSPYLHDIPWVHYTCGKMLEGNTGDFNYQRDLGEYEARLDLIPLDRFTKKCAFCTDPIYAEYGAKLSCTDCDKSFHVTCAQMNEVAYSLNTKKARCLSHYTEEEVLNNSEKSGDQTARNKPTTQIAQKIQRSRDYSTWINLKEAYLLKYFNKNSRMFAIDSWKILARDPGSFSVGNEKINRHYAKFLRAIKNTHYEVEGTRYSRWIDYSLSFFNSVYSARDMETYTVSFSSELFASHKLIWQHYNFQDDTSEASSPSDADDTKYINNNDSTASGRSKKHSKSNGIIGTINPSSALLTPPDLKRPPQVCSICKKTKFPAETCAYLGITEQYLKDLKQTRDKRPPGYTGKGPYWDPRVFIQCSKCLSNLHCGCPDYTIKNYPEKNKVFVCIMCDRNGELIAAPQTLGSRRGRKINYKE